MEGFIKAYDPQKAKGIIAAKSSSDLFIFERDDISFSMNEPKAGVAVTFEVEHDGAQKYAIGVILDDADPPERFIRVGLERFLPSDIRRYGIRNESERFMAKLAAAQHKGQTDVLSKWQADEMTAGAAYTLALRNDLHALFIETQNGREYLFYETEIDVAKHLDMLDKKLGPT